METDVAVIGGGFSANAMVIHLLDQLAPSKTIAVIADGDDFGLGVAYGTKRDCHLLNVPACRMSVYVDQPHHLVDWLVARELPYRSEDFIPRRLYGEYLKESLAKALAKSGNHARVDFVRSRALACQTGADGRHSFALANDEIVKSGHSVFCLGATAASLPLPAHKISVD